MSETTTGKETKKKPLKLNRPSTLQLRKTVETGQVRQSFSHGRSKTVMVEVKRSRTFAPGEGGRMTEVVAPEFNQDFPEDRPGSGAHIESYRGCMLQHIHIEIGEHLGEWISAVL